MLEEAARIQSHVVVYLKNKNQLSLARSNVLVSIGKKQILKEQLRSSFSCIPVDIIIV